MPERDLLCDAAPERESDEVDVVETERADERGRVGGHRGDRVRDLAGGGADAAVVEGDHVPLGVDAVDDARVPVVENRRGTPGGCRLGAPVLGR
jgi:hypothetical protein